MGDVAMTVPVVHSLAVQYPQLRITMLTHKRLVPFFSWMPDNVQTIGLDIKAYKGLAGLNRLYAEIMPLGCDAVADIHDVIRTKYLRLRFSLSGRKVAVIDKGRKEKKRLLGNAIHSDALIPMTERYRKVFLQLGLPFELSFDHICPTVEELSQIAVSDSYNIGIAPFAAHQGKVYPLEKMKRVVDLLAEDKCHVYLFGAGKEEKAILESWERDGVESVSGKMGGLKNELLLMSKLDVMLSMDSSNMHMAAMMGTRCVSVWGATHPKAGFVAWKQPLDSIIQKEFPCRPCSIYGNKPCKMGDFCCMNSISPEEIVEKIRNGRTD